MNNFEALILDFRVSELRELLQILGLKKSGLKNVLQKRILSYLRKPCPLTQQKELEQKIQELYYQSKLPPDILRAKKTNPECSSVPPAMTTPDPIITAIATVDINSVFFKTVEYILLPQAIDLRNGSKTFEFCFTEDQVALLSEENEENNFYEVMLKVCCIQNDEEWPAFVLHAVMNNSAIEVPEPSPHIIYLTRYCCKDCRTQNILTLSSPLPMSLSSYIFSVSLVKRTLVNQLMDQCPPKSSNLTRKLVSDYFAKNKIVKRLELHLACPVKMKIMEYPTRGSECKHVDVFDLQSFLEEMQFYFKWKCPFCQKLLTYESLVVDMYLQKYAQNNKSLLVFHKRRKILPNDSEVVCVEELIELED
ncbi:E3 SUMO-protein ligase PIAS4-like [Stegodyphus dumicola]|uniref:E3 SUMO-protein ligase PIAS4-like n=1 Tax=Stegodyphus dumicola TaxID=202533 RepID=UPI0015A9F3F9|nr:E3 SUMO-protein ligase PIAS4-like [Stegodyphus dumicola]